MEMEYKDPSRKGRWIVLLGIVLAVVAGGAAFYLISTAKTTGGAGSVPVTKGYVAARPIKAGTAITKDDIALKEDIPSSKVQDPLLFTKDTDVLGKSLAISVPEGQVLTTNMLATSTTALGFQILDPLETVAPDSEAWRAVSISVSDDRAVGGVLGPKMIVDVVLTASVLPPYVAPTDSPDPNSTATPAPTPTPVAWYIADRSTKITYQNVTILARQGTYYVLKVSLQVAEEMAHLQADGSTQFSLVLRPDQDHRTLDVSALGETTNRIIERYGLLYPELFPQPNQPARTNPPIPSLTPAPSPTDSPAAAPSAAPSSAPSASPAG